MTGVAVSKRPRRVTPPVPRSVKESKSSRDFIVIVSPAFVKWIGAVTTGFVVIELTDVEKVEPRIASIEPFETVNVPAANRPTAEHVAHETNAWQFVNARDDPIDTTWNWPALPSATPATTEVTVEPTVSVTALLTNATVLRWSTTIRRTTSIPRVTPPPVTLKLSASNLALDSRVHMTVAAVPNVMPMAVAVEDATETLAAMFEIDKVEPVHTLKEVEEMAAKTPMPDDGPRTVILSPATVRDE